MNTIAKPKLRPNTQDSSLDFSFQAILEGFIDGILILTHQGKLVHANDTARKICQGIDADAQTPESPDAGMRTRPLFLSSITDASASVGNSGESNFVPQAIWRVCLNLIESRKLYPHQPMILESQMATGDLSNLRVRVQWLQLAAFEHPCILVTLENQTQSLQNLALAEAYQYGLTSRETEVWLLRRSQYTYNQIAAELFISLNTVKKHLKNILAKQKMTVE
ncbi:MAG: helix-turn-helix transcriptional regulator [Symploca sp. SIO2E6]|nr:helix-turn-helix transcriptional regulator [Symploca sp. SIO2E6]